MPHPADLTIPEAGLALRAGRMTSVALVQAHLDRIADRNPSVRAFVALCPERALTLAAAADAKLQAGQDRGALHGIPFAVKDLIDVAGLPTRCGSHATPDRPALQDARAVAQLVAAGAIPLGKLATYEFALTGPGFDGPFPPALNPADPAHITGGSSSGAAAAVAAGLVRMALGTDTGGSIRSPSAFCGVVGLKPPFGMVSGEGVYPLSPTLDHVGPIAASVTEAALMLAALTPLGAVAGGVQGLRIGYARDWFATDPATDPATLAATDHAAAVLARAGATVAPVTLPDYALAEAAGAIILHAEALEIHLPHLKSGAPYGRQACQSLAAGAGLTAADVALARKVATLMRAEMEAALAGLDAIITATTLTPAPPMPADALEQTIWTPMRTLPFNLTGHPALSVPVAHAGRLPIGLQIIGRMDGTAMICRIGAMVQSLLPR